MIVDERIRNSTTYGLHGYGLDLYSLSQGNRSTSLS
jgi:hypothetical protein